MGANTSRHRYEYSYGGPGRDYYARPRATSYAHGEPYYGQQAGVMPAYPSAIYPVGMQPMQQVAGPPVGLAQQQPVMQMSQPQVHPAFVNPPVMTANLVPPLPVPQVPQPQMQPGVMPQPQPQHSFSPGPPGAMPEPAVQQGAGMPGITPVIPQSFTRRVPSDSTSYSSSSSDSRRRRRRRRRSIDPLERNPLPVPPREVEAPDDMLAGTAMAPRGPPLPRPASPLNNPLPPPPRDVYMLRKYRPLLIGTAYADRKKDVYPKNWFEDPDWSDREGGLGRVLERLNPFRPHRNDEFSPRHRRSETMPVLPDFPDFVRQSSGSGSEDTYASPGERRPGMGRSFSSFLPFGHRRQESEAAIPMPIPAQGQPPSLADGQAPPSGFMPMPSPVVAGPTGQPQSAHPLSPLPSQAQPVNPLYPAPQPANPLTPGPPQQQPIIPLSPVPPQSQTMSMPQPQTMGSMTPRPPQPQSVNPLTPGPPQGMPMPTPARPLSPTLPPVVAGEGPHSPNSHSDSTLPEIVFNQDTPGYGGLTHLSQHNVLYKGKLYPTAAHLFEAFRFLGRDNKLAKRVRETETRSELNALLRNIGQYTRPDWEDVLVEKMEEALYRKIVQHRDLSEMLLGTGEAELIYDDPADWFWGEGEEGEGRNELGRALMRIRDRMRREEADHEHR